MEEIKEVIRTLSIIALIIAYGGVWTWINDIDIRKQTAFKVVFSKFWISVHIATLLGLVMWAWI